VATKTQILSFVELGHRGLMATPLKAAEVGVGPGSGWSVTEWVLGMRFIAGSELSTRRDEA